MKYGMKKEDFEDLINNGDNSNANLSFSPEMVVQYTYEAVAKEYNLSIMPKQCRKAYLDGFIHHHDLHGAILKPNCLNHNIRFYAKNGLKIDGKGESGAVAKPAKSLEVLLNHMLQAFMAGACVLTGGQAFTNFNTFLAPFAKGRSYSEIKQAIQGFIFNCNMSLVARGGQVLFSSIGLDLSMPDVLKDIPAVCPGNVIIGTYKDYMDEFDLIFRAVCEVLDEKDGQGAYFRFPNTLFSIRDGDLDEYTGNCKLLHELGANNPTIYYVNCTDAERTVMGALTSDTPVMTNEGFKYPNQLCIGDTVMTYAEDGSKEWNKIYNIIPKIAPEKVFKITCDNNYMFKVTNNHKLPTNEGIIKSEDLKVGMELYNYLDDFYSPTDDYYFEFIGMFLADGYIKKSKNDYNKGRSAIEFHVKLDWKKEAITDICDKCNYEYDVIPKKDGTVSIYVREYDLKDELYELYDSNGVKHFPNVWDNKNKVANIIKGLMLDANKQKNRFVWSCSDLPLVTDVLYALSMIGRENTLYVDNRSGDTGKWRTNYRVTFGAKYKPKNKTKIKSIELVDNNDIVYDLSIENNANYVCGLGGIHSENCRTSNQLNYTGDYFRDCLGAGNFMYSTLNLPLIALTYKEDFFKYLDKYVEIIYDTLKWRREQVTNTIYNKHMSDFLLWEDDEDKLYNFDTSSMTIGVCGLYECVKQLEKIDGFVPDIDDFYDDGLGVRIMKFINKKVDEFKERDGLRWGVIGSPAESTAYKFGKINVEKFPEEAIVQGTKDTPYLTNSTHIPVNSESNIIDHIRNADAYHPLTRAGNILHLWLGEVWSDPESLWRLNQKITGTGTQFWAYSKVFTYCQQCGYTINDNLSECPICKSKDLRVYDRCFSGDTKIFVRKDNIIKPVDLKDFVENYDYKSWQVPVFDSKTQSYVWCNVKRVIKNPAESMIKIGFNKGYNVTCTPNHNFFKYSNTRKSMYETIKADELHIKDRIMNHRCPVFFDEGNENVLGTFIGFVLGDGSFNNKDSLNIYIRIKVYKPEKRDYLKWLLEANNLDYSLNEGLDERWNSKTYSFGIGANNVGNPAYDIFNKYSNKHDIIKECYNTDLMLGIFAGLINSDGSVLIGRKNQVITTFNQVDRDILYCFYWIAMLLGVNPSLSFTEREGYESVGRIEMSSIKMWDLLHKIHLREPFKTNVENGVCRADAKRVNGMCSVKSIEEAPVQESYCIEVEHEDHNTLFNGVLAQNCTGYYLPIKTWNKGKKQEFNDRYRHRNI